MADTQLTFKNVKIAFIVIQKTRVNLAKQYAIIARIWYKSKAQHKSAEWFRAIDGVRKCLRRLLDKSADQRQQQQQHQQRDVEPRNKSKKESGKADGEIFCGAFDRACSSIVQLWCSYWGEESVRNDNVLPKFDGLPNQLPSIDSLRSAVHHLEELIAIMEELSNRTKIAANSLISHLRTPPAPTFAPITTACVAIMSALHSETDRFLHGSQFNTTSDNQQGQNNSIKSFYGIINSTYELQRLKESDEKSSSSLSSNSRDGLILHSGNTSSQKRKNTNQASVSQAGKKQKSDKNTKRTATEQIITNIDELEEDLGEVV